LCRNLRGDWIYGNDTLALFMTQQKNIKAKLEEARSKISEDEQKALESLRVRAFNKVAVFVVGAFCTYLLLVALFIILATFLKVEWKPGFDALLELMKIAGLPVTMTVLGYYAASK